ncbi:MAG: radical SAM protein, partial [bacterium]|nr:radical SAM protein [bacterium]
MNISNFTFIVTDSCNFRCTYCVQKKEKNVIENATIKRAVDFFYPHFKTDGTVHIGFYGGEPLMAYDQVRYAVELIRGRNTTAKKDTRFSLTTNGTFLTDEMLELFNENRFSLMLSFDGLAQDMGRKKGSIEKTVEAMNKIRRYPDIDFEINSVFTPQTIEKLSGSMRFMIEPGGPEITFCLATTVQWNF